MNEVVEAIIIGVVQGLTEFLPVSSSGHIELAEEILQVEQTESMIMTIVLHAATALSTVVVYRNDIWEIIRGFFKFEKNEQLWFVLKIILSMIPGALAGYFLEEWLETLFDGQILLVGCMLLITAVLLYFADQAKNTNKDVSFRDAFIIGVSQMIAILPGISRSGATISTSVLLGNDRSRAARFSFLMVVPLILGAISKKLIDSGGVLEVSNGTALFAGFMAAFISGIIACRWMIALVKKAKLTYFSIYCAIVGTLAILYALFIR
ncbi:MAG: undecaprenyl-diphosphate phosphatase [Weeksellaceae bacterium]|nr:undecaprenyl-diphosphate phosphatase [Weeksellaceae bacterium]